MWLKSTKGLPKSRVEFMWSLIEYICDLYSVDGVSSGVFMLDFSSCCVMMLLNESASNVNLSSCVNCAMYCVS